MKYDIAPLRVEQIKKWLEQNKEYLSQALITDRVEIVLSLKGVSVKVKITQFPDES